MLFPGKVKGPVSRAFLEADARIRTANPFIASVDQESPQDAPSRATPHRSKGSPPPKWRPKTSNDKGVDSA
jgi:hypothetical protein